MYAAKNLHAARWKLVAFYQHAAEADVPELNRLAKTVSTWETEILNYHVTGISNGTNRGPEPHRREASKDRARDAQLRELSAQVVAPLGRDMEHSINCSNQRPPPTPHGVKPSYQNER
jgi:hypothetical protein